MSNVVEIDDRRAAYRAGEITTTESMPIPWVMRNHAHDRAEQIVFEYKSSTNTWASVTWCQSYAGVRALARGLLALGVEPNDRIAIMSHSCCKFALSDQVT